MQIVKSLKVASLCAVISIISLLFIPAAALSREKEKVGILFLHVGGGDEHYTAEWIPGFFNNLFSFMPEGMHTGGWVGNDNDTLKCYTQVHYANEAEAEACDCAETTLIDIFCNEYDAATAVYSIKDDFGPTDKGGNGSFSVDCNPGFGVPYAMQTAGADWNSTVDPNDPNGPNGGVINGPVLAPGDSYNPGQGVAEFHEVIAWGRMAYFAELPNGYDPSKRDWKKWWYGNDAPGCDTDPQCSPDSPERANLKDELLDDTSLTDKYDFVFRHGWEASMRNKDIYGEPTVIADSTETAINELVDAGVSKIVVAHAQPVFANLSQYGDDWKMTNRRYDPSGTGVSRVAGETYQQCVEELDDPYGPVDQDDIDEYVATKPWANHVTKPWPEIVDMVDTADPSVDLIFARPFGEFPGFAESTLQMLNYTIDKYDIPDNNTVSLKVILVDHGFFGGHQDAATCDVWFTENEDMFNNVSAHILADTVKSQFTNFEVVRGFGEYAEGHYSNSDTPSAENPEGVVLSMGEQIDRAINGTYVNSQKILKDNGINNYEYVVAIPYFFEGFNSDFHEKKETLGMWNDHGRAGTSPDGDAWDSDDYDNDEYFVKVDMDGTVFETIIIPSISTECTAVIASTSECTTATEILDSDPPVCTYTCEIPDPEADPITAYKGSTTNPSTVIITGPALSVADPLAPTGIREGLVNALYDSIKDALVSYPTLVELESLVADPGSKAVTLEWVTASELDNAGFNIYRADGQNGDFVKINGALIPARGNGVGGAAYAYRDTGLENGKSYYYQLEDIDLNGNVTTHEPVRATPRLLYILKK